MEADLRGIKNTPQRFWRRGSDMVCFLGSILGSDWREPYSDSPSKALLQSWGPRYCPGAWGGRGLRTGRVRGMGSLGLESLHHEGKGLKEHGLLPRF